MEIIKEEISTGLITSKAKNGYLSIRINENYTYKSGEILSHLESRGIRSAVIENKFDCKVLYELLNIEVLYFSSNMIFNCSSFYELNKLKKIQLDFSYKMSIDFSKFKMLKEVDIDWNENLLFKGADSLKYLILRKYGNEIFELELNENIEFLELIQGKLKSVRGIEKYQNLKALVLYSQPKMEDYLAIGELQSLEFLHLQGGHLKDVNFITKLKNLKWLVLENCKEIETLKPLLQLENLEGVQLVGVTKVADGDKSIRDIKNKYEYHYPYKTVTQRLYKEI
jgi:Leucine-rich repeat (LRR) protein